MKGFPITDRKHWHSVLLGSLGTVLRVAPKSGHGMWVGHRQIGSFLCSTSQVRGGRENGGVSCALEECLGWTTQLGEASVGWGGRGRMGRNRRRRQHVSGTVSEDALRSRTGQLSLLKSTGWNDR